jgi:lipopolysaccharide transport system permease protein
MVRDIIRSRTIAWNLMKRDLVAQYRQSALGILWAFVPPIVMATGFTLASNARIFNVGEVDVPYPVFVALSTSLWQVFVEALRGPLDAVVKNRQLLVRVAFPREGLVLAKIGEIGFNLLPKVLLIIGLFAWYETPFRITALLAPLALLSLVMLGTWFGLLLAPIGAIYQDVARGMGIVIALWFLVTPVAYVVPKAGVLGRIVSSNPVTPLLVTVRELVTTGVVTNPGAFWLVTAVTMFGLGVAWVLYRLAMPLAIERLGS